jgi:transaldolase/glucose-6-phosphate isomerase
MDAFRDHGGGAEPDRGRRRRPSGPGRGRAAGPRPGRRHRPAGRRRREAVRRGVRQAAGAVAAKRAKFLGDAQNARASACRGPAGAGRRDPDRARRARAGRGACGRRRLLWTGADEAQVARLAGGGQRRARSTSPPSRPRRRGQGRRLHPRPAAGHGRLEPGPEVLASPSAGPGHPPLLVLDSTDPAQIARIEAQIDPAGPCSSSPASRARPWSPTSCTATSSPSPKGAGRGQGGRLALHRRHRPGLKLERTARRAQGFAHVFSATPQIGGRYSVLSNFGMVPAAVLGRDVRRAFETPRPWCAPATPAPRPPPIRAFAWGSGDRRGGEGRARQADPDRLADPGIKAFGAWLEQLIAESTGKHGKGVIPVDGERLGRRRSTAPTACSPICASRARTSRERRRAGPGARGGRPSGGAHHPGRPRRRWPRNSSAGRSPSPSPGR